MRTLLAILGALGGILVLWAVFGAMLWIIIVLGAFTIPALWDMLSNRTSCLDLSQHEISWKSGSTSGYFPLIKIEKIRLDTRVDFSVRVTLLLKDGTKLRLPYDCLPPHKQLESALIARGIATERHHFSPF